MEDLPTLIDQAGIAGIRSVGRILQDEAEQAESQPVINIAGIRSVGRILQGFQQLRQTTTSQDSRDTIRWEDTARSAKTRLYSTHPDSRDTIRWEDTARNSEQTTVGLTAL